MRIVLGVMLLFVSGRLIAQQQSLPLPKNSQIVLAPSARNNPQQVQKAAMSVASDLKALLHMPSDAALLPTATRLIGNVWHSSFALSYAGIPVRDAAISVDLGALNGQLLNVSQRLMGREPNTLSATISADVISHHVRSYLGFDSLQDIFSFSKPNLLFVASRGVSQLRLCYQTTVHQLGREWRLTIDAMTGKLIEKKEMLEFIGGEGDKPLRTAKGLVRALVHPRTPYDPYDTVPLPFTRVNIFDNSGKKLIGQAVTDSLGVWSASVPFGSYVKSQFSGPYETVVRHDDDDHVRDSAWFGFSDTLTWNDFISDDAERDAYYHASVARAYAHRTDTALGAVDSMLTINVNLDLACNAFYSPDSISLNFFHSSTKCSNTAKIADIVYHEFGHRVAHIRYAGGANGNLVNYTLGEGFADLYSAFLRDDPRIAIGIYSGQPTKYLRTCENRMTFPDSISADSHISGGIISGAFWDLRKAIGHDAAERIFHRVEWMTPDAPDETSPDILKQAFIETLTDALLVDDDDNDLSNGTPHSKEILAAFAKHGITLGELIGLNPQTIGDQDSTANGYPVILQESYHGPMDGIDASSIILHYSTNGQHYDTTLFEPLHDSTFRAVIPKQNAGTIVSYYVSAHLLGDSSSIAYWPPPSQPLRFTIGYEKWYYDDCEQQRGWSFEDASDNATRGLWVRDTPNGTYNIPTDYVQQDTDHSPHGAMCYVTGNAKSPDVNFDDVDSGKTTLTTNAIDLSGYNSPVLRYWYYYTNDEGDHPGEPQWLVEITDDDGAHWKIVQSSNQSTEGWTSNLVRVSDYVIPSSHVRLRFTASDFVGAIVEAGIDDIEALSAPESISSAVINSIASNFAITGVRPNPASSQQITIDYSAPTCEHVTLDIRNVLGERIEVLEDRMMQSGAYRAQCPPLPAGTYWIVFASPDARSIRRLVIQ